MLGLVNVNEILYYDITNYHNIRIIFLVFREIEK